MHHASLVALGQLLRARRYCFTTITPASHARVLARDAQDARDLRDALGWSRAFARGSLDADVERLLEDADALVPIGDGQRVRARVRASTLDDALYFHSAFPTEQADAVFFGPDTYRFVSLLDHWLPHAEPLGRLVDVGAGAGAGGLSLAARARDVVLADVNPDALALCDVNARVNRISNVTTSASDVLVSISGPIDIVVANPPYLVDASERTYRHGGDRGIALALRILDEALARLSPGGRCLIYTGTPVVDGASLFVDRARAIVARYGARIVRLEELDPDVFGEELSTPAYADVERIALVGLLAKRM